MMDIYPIRTDADYERALKDIEQYFDHEPEPDSPEGQRFDILAALIAQYENEHYPIEAPDPVEAIRFTMERLGVGQPALAELLGSRSRASEILNRKRPLTVDMIHRLVSQWHIPAEALVKPYHLAG